MQPKAPDGSDSATDGTHPAEPAASGALLRGASWNTLAQMTPVVVNLVLTPFVIHGLGIVQYGLYALAATFTVFLAAVNGGIGPAAPRFFAVFAGRGDRRSLTRLLVTLLLIVVVGGGAISLADWFCAPLIASALHMPGRYRHGSVFLLRTYGVIVTSNFVGGLFVSVVQAHQRYSLTSRATIVSYLGWAGGLFLAVRLHGGLEGVALALMAEQVLAAALVMPFALRYLDFRSIGLASRAEVRQFFGFSAKSQLSGLNMLFMLEFDAIIIGAVLSVRDVGLYNAGANVASQLLTLSVAALPPVTTHLAAIFGRCGEAATVAETARLQRFWVVGMAGWWTAAVASVYFGVVAWLGPQFQVSGIVCVILAAGYGAALTVALLPAHANAVGRPGVEARYGLVALGLNLLLTVPLAFVGVIGVVAATAIGFALGALYLVHLARKELSPAVGQVLQNVPVLRALGCGAVTVGLELLVAPHAPQGPLGLILCGVPAVVALAGYALSFIGLRRAATSLRALARGGRLVDLL